jgi:hypothetical protein
MSNGRNILFTVRAPLGFTVRVTREYWAIITTVKHPAMAGCEAEARAVLESPEEIRRSKSDAKVYFFYRSRRIRRWVCAVSKQEGHSGFLITAYVTNPACRELGSRKTLRHGRSRPIRRILKTHG